MANPEILQFLEQEATAWASEFVRDRVAFLRRRKIEATGELIRSLEFEVTAQAGRSVVELLLAFEESGRFIDMRRLQPPEGGADYIAALINWIQRKGLAEKFTRGYVRRRNLKQAPDRVLTYIAFGIARKRFNGKYRRRRWYNKNKSRSLSDLVNRIAANMPDAVFDELRNSLKK